MLFKRPQINGAFFPPSDTGAETLKEIPNDDVD
jgi:hypothetical protein